MAIFIYWHSQPAISNAWRSTMVSINSTAGRAMDVGSTSPRLVATSVVSTISIASAWMAARPCPSALIVTQMNSSARLHLTERRSRFPRAVLLRGSGGVRVTATSMNLRSGCCGHSTREPARTSASPHPAEPKNCGRCGALTGARCFTSRIAQTRVTKTARRTFGLLHRAAPTLDVFQTSPMGACCGPAFLTTDARSCLSTTLRSGSSTLWVVKPAKSRSRVAEHLLDQPSSVGD